MTTSDSIPQKRCTKCGEEYPATAEFFRRDSGKKDGFKSWCKDCIREYSPKRIRHYKRRLYTVPETLCCSKCGTEFPLTSEYFHRNRTKRRGFRGTCKVCIATDVRNKQRDNPEKAREYQRRSYANNPKTKQWYQQYWQIKAQRRRSLERALPATLTAAEWQVCLEYFHHTCAYCGAQQDFWHVLEQDHLKPLIAGGAYTAENIVPACKSCNASKGSKPINEWLSDMFSKRKAKAIINRITGYFEWRKEQS